MTRISCGACTLAPWDNTEPGVQLSLETQPISCQLDMEEKERGDALRNSLTLLQQVPLKVGDAAAMLHRLEVVRALRELFAQKGAHFRFRRCFTLTTGPSDPTAHCLFVLEPLLCHLLYSFDRRSAER